MTVWFCSSRPTLKRYPWIGAFKHTDKDATLTELKKCVQKDRFAKSIDKLKPYRAIFCELAFSDEELLMKGEKIVLPESLYDTALKKAHQGGQPGMNGLKKRLQSHFWFQQMDKKIEEKVESCQQ